MQTFFVSSVPSPELREVVESLTAFAKYGNVSPSEYWCLTHQERAMMTKKLNEMLSEEAKHKAKRDESFLKCIAKIVHGAFGKR
jgi:hypothetical protein